MGRVIGFLLGAVGVAALAFLGYKYRKEIKAKALDLYTKVESKVSSK
jgi:hypothetical protein